jgi:hypothetical protein
MSWSCSGRDSWTQEPLAHGFKFVISMRRLPAIAPRDCQNPLRGWCYLDASKWKVVEESALVGRLMG